MSNPFGFPPNEFSPSEVIATGSLIIEKEFNAHLNNLSLGIPKVSSPSFSAAPPLLVLSKNNPDSSPPAIDSNPLKPKKRPNLLKPYPKHFVRKKTSFLNSWSMMVNSDLLENCCVKVQIPGLLPEKPGITSSAQASFSHSDFKFPGSKVNFVRGLPASFLNKVCHKNQPLDRDSDGDSIASASRDELEKFGSEGFHKEEELNDGFGFEFRQLFQSEEGHSLGKAKESLFSPLDTSEIPQHLHSIIDACGLVLGEFYFKLYTIMKLCWISSL